MSRIVRGATAGFAGFSMLLLAFCLGGFGTLPVVIVLLAAGNACLGFVIPSVMVLALDDQGEVAGLASSLGGTIQMVMGGLMVVAAGPFFDGTVTPMVAGITVCAVSAFLLARAMPDQAAAVAT